MFATFPDPAGKEFDADAATPRSNGCYGSYGPSPDRCACTHKPVGPSPDRMDEAVPAYPHGHRARGRALGGDSRGVYGAIARLQGKPRRSARPQERLQQALDRLYPRVWRGRRCRGRRGRADSRPGGESVGRAVARSRAGRRTIPVCAPRGRPVEDPRQGAALSLTRRSRRDRSVHRTDRADPRGRLDAPEGGVDGRRTRRADGRRSAAGCRPRSRHLRHAGAADGVPGAV